MRRLLSLGLLLALAPAAEAQMVVVRPQELDSARAEVLATFRDLRDTVKTVEAAVAQLERGFATSSDQLLASRSRRLAQACQASLRNLPQARAVAASHSWTEDLATKWQGDLVSNADRLSGVLEGCGTRWHGYGEKQQLDQLRSEGLADARAISREVLEFMGTVEGYYKVLGIRPRPMNP